MGRELRRRHGSCGASGLGGRLGRRGPVPVCLIPLAETNSGGKHAAKYHHGRQRTPDSRIAEKKLHKAAGEKTAKPYQNLHFPHLSLMSGIFVPHWLQNRPPGTSLLPHLWQKTADIGAEVPVGAGVSVGSGVSAEDGVSTGV